METGLILTIGNRTTTIPSTETGHDDPARPPFRPLKGRPDDVPAIPEVENCDALKNALTTINDSSTPFFTIGCGKSFNSEQESHWVRGYVSFSFNHMELAKDSPNYFLLFEQFNNYVLGTKFNLPVDFNFEISGADFTSVPASGYLSRVWITTTEFPAMDLPKKLWNQSVGFLADFLGSYEKPPMPEIYS
jgi:hypothetical protein